MAGPLNGRLLSAVLAGQERHLRDGTKVPFSQYLYAYERKNCQGETCGSDCGAGQGCGKYLRLSGEDHAQEGRESILYYAK